MASSEFKSFFKCVTASEGDRCRYNTRLDTYGCGCQHNCDYCYARSLLSFRKLWVPDAPKVADVEKVRRKVAKLEPGSFVRLGGMTDCFMPIERRERKTLEAIKALNSRGVNYLIVTKSDMVASPEYVGEMDKRLAHVQITVTSTDEETASFHEPGAPAPAKRISAAEKLQEEGFDVALRLSPFVPEWVDLMQICGAGVNKVLVEFLRVNSWIEKWMNASVDLSRHTLNRGGVQAPAAPGENRHDRAAARERQDGDGVRGRTGAFRVLAGPCEPEPRGLLQSEAGGAT